MTKKTNIIPEKPLIIILMPMGDSIAYEAFMPYTEMFMGLIGNGWRVRLFSTARRPHAIARNELMKKAIKFMKEEETPEYILWMDDDHVIDKDDVFKLMNITKQFKLDCVSAAYLTRTIPSNVCALTVATTVKNSKTPSKYRLMHSYTPDTLYEVDGIGLGMCLMNPQILKDIYKRTPVPFGFVPRENDHLMGEDLLFCEQIKKSKYKIYVHTGIFIGHLLTMNLTPKLAKLLQTDKEFHKRDVGKTEEDGKEHKSEGKQKRKRSKKINGKSTLSGRKTKTKTKICKR